MKKKILLIDESLTVQKVVALTLDKSKYQLSFAKSRPEVMKMVLENPPDLILLSDQIADFSASSFPKEMETWLGGVREAAPVVLITAQDLKEQKHFAAILRKPFSPQALQDLVQELIEARVVAASHEDQNELEEERLQRIFNDTFADESTLVRETFRAELEAEEPTAFHAVRGQTSEGTKTSLWEVSHPKADQRGDKTDEMWRSQNTYEVAKEAGQMQTTKDFSEGDVEKYISTHKLDEVLDKVLARVVPPIVEKIVNERLDKLLKEQEQFLELKS